MSLYEQAVSSIHKKRYMDQAVWKIPSNMLPDLLRAKSPSGEYIVSCQNGQYHLMGYLVKIDDAFEELTFFAWGTFEKVGPNEWVCEKCYEEFLADYWCLTDTNFTQSKCYYCNTDVGEHHVINAPKVLPQKVGPSEHK